MCDSPTIYLLQMFWVIDLIVNIRHHLQRATQWWNRLPVMRKTQPGSGLTIVSLSVWNDSRIHLCAENLSASTIKPWMWIQPVEIFKNSWQLIDILHKFMCNSLQLFLSSSTIIHDLKINTFNAMFQTSSRGRNYHEAMMALRDSSTSPAVSLCWGSNTSSFRIRHTVFSDTRPSLWGGGGETGRDSFICKMWLSVASPQSYYWKIILPLLQVRNKSENVVNSQQMFCIKNILIRKKYFGTNI